jgi:hypothetical protein
MKSTLVATSAALLLSGCVAVADLTTNETISDRERAIIKTLAERIPKTCVLVQLKSHTLEKIEGSDRKSYKKLAEIRRLYLSDGDWFRATALLDSVWDEIYLNERTGQLICGEQAWKKYADSGNIKFYEFGTQPSPRLTLVSGAKQTEVVTPTAIEKFRESLKPQLVYRRDVEVCDDLRLASEVSTRLLKGQDIQQIALEMSKSKTVGSAGGVGDFGLKLMKAGEMSDKLGLDKTQALSVYQQCGQQYPK